MSYCFTCESNYVSLLTVVRKLEIIELTRFSQYKICITEAADVIKLAKTGRVEDHCSAVDGVTSLTITETM